LFIIVVSKLNIFIYCALYLSIFLKICFVQSTNICVLLQKETPLCLYSKYQHFNYTETNTTNKCWLCCLWKKLLCFYSVISCYCINGNWHIRDIFSGRDTATISYIYFINMFQHETKRNITFTHSGGKKMKDWNLVYQILTCLLFRADSFLST
jgi:hypothetical protein